MIPVKTSLTGSLLVSVYGVSTSFVYDAVIKRHLITMIDWFLNQKVYTPFEMINGLRVERFYIGSPEGCWARYENGKYYQSLKTTEDILLDRFNIDEYPEYHI